MGETPGKPIQHYTNRANKLRGTRPADDPERIAAEREAAAERLATYVKKIVDQAPPLTDEQRTRIAALLRAPGDAGTR